jgi:hypothetical protein
MTVTRPMDREPEDCPWEARLLESFFKLPVYSVFRPI